LKEFLISELELVFKDEKQKMTLADLWTGKRLLMEKPEKRNEIKK